jgi:hypothetical protein
MTNLFDIVVLMPKKNVPLIANYLEKCGSFSKQKFRM